MDEAMGARAPQRQRGRERVAAILEAAIQVFGEKGFDKATMTEIAQCSHTAIGSLYRFFPSKELLADALLDRYASTLAQGLDEVAGQAQASTMTELTELMIKFVIDLNSRRGIAVGLMDARGGSDHFRLRFRATIRMGVANVLKQAIPELTPDRANLGAIMLMLILKGITTLEQEDAACRPVLLDEIRHTARLYLGTLARVPNSLPPSV